MSNQNQKPGQSQQNQDHTRQGQQQQDSGGHRDGKNPNQRDQRPTDQPKRDQKPGAGKTK